MEYDGTDYHGWQRQKNDRTIQGEIEKALCAMTRQPVSLIGSGRTDAGVHALGQTANFSCETNLSADAFKNGLNSILDNDITIISCDVVAHTFHSRFDAKSKSYVYRILNTPCPSPTKRRYCWWIGRTLNISEMKKSIKILVGTYDFKAFEGTGSPRAHTIRNVIRAGIDTDSNGCIDIYIEANGFLKYMVRNIVGTLIDVGLDRISRDTFEQIFKSKDRKKAGITAPPQGLFLIEVKY